MKNWGAGPGGEKKKGTSLEPEYTNQAMERSLSLDCLLSSHIFFQGRQ